MNLSRNEIIVTAGVILLHGLLILLSLGKTTSHQDSQDAIRAQLISPPSPSQAPAATPPVKSSAPDTKKEKKQSSKEKSQAPQSIREEGAKAPNDKPVATTTNTAAAGSATPSAPPAVDLNQLVILYKPDTESFYPTFSKRIGEEGNVEVRLQIDETGSVQGTQVTLSSGSPRLDKAAMDLAQKIRFKPHTRNGVAIAITAKIGVKFKLKD